MRIACPACAAAYEVPKERLPPGRVVRCARCDSAWTPVPMQEVAPEPPPAADVAFAAAEESWGVEAAQPVGAAVVQEPAPLAVVEESYAPPRVRHPTALRAAWALSGVVLLAAVWLAYSARDRVMQAWPPSVRAYAALGLAARH